jgi:hypothetical protein
MPFWDDIAEGIFEKGVNKSTFVALNAALGAVVLALLLLLASAIASQPSLVPHVIVLLLLACGLWASIAWFCTTVGFSDAQQPAVARPPAQSSAMQPAANGPTDPHHQPYVSSEIEPASPVSKKDQ